MVTFMRIRNKYSLETIKSESNGNPLSIDEIHDELLLMMKSFHCFCEKNNLKYFLAGGTLLGAIRHNGFIPWDDDVDIYMLRDDYEKLVSFSHIDDDLEIVTFKRSHSYYHPYPYCNITSRKTIQIEYNSRYMSGKGIFLDIFPVDGLPNDYKRRYVFYRKINRLRYIKGLPLNNYKKVKSFKDIIFNLCVFFLRPLDEIKTVKKIDLLAKSNILLECDDCEQVVIPSKLHCPKAYYSSPVLHKFEDTEFYIPRDFDDILRRQYGDYMVLPPESQRKGQHGVEVFYRKG